MKKLLTLFALIGLFATACEEEGVNEPTNTPTETPDDGNDEKPDDGNDDTEKPVFEINGDGNYIVEAVGGTVAVKVTTNLEYDVVIDKEAQSWLSVADTRAVREETLIFTVAENESFDERSATVELKGADGKVLQSVSFKQKGVEKVFDTDSEGNYIVEADGGTVAVKVTTNLEYDVIIPNEALAWISLADTRAVREETLTLNVAKNEGSEERSATVNLCAKGGDILQCFNISQKAQPVIDFADPIVKQVCIERYDSNDDGELSYKEAAQVKVIEGNYPESFFGDYAHAVKSFDELQYFVNLTSIGNSAFSGCTSLTSITIPDSVTLIGGSAFYGCTGELIVNCNIPSATWYDEGAFYGADFTKVTIGDSVTLIGDYAFSDCTSLTSITIPDSVTEIGEYAFRYCDSLTSITIPDSVTTIGSWVFYGCTSLTSVTIGNGVTKIGDFAFYECRSLTSITIPDSVTEIGEHAFSGCTSLTSMTIPESVTSIGSHAFSGCTGELIVNCNIPSATSLDKGKFIGADFTKVTIGDSVTKIGSYAFYNCNSLTSVTIGNGVTTIEEMAFYNCDSLTSITIGNSVTKIGSYAFRYCDSLTSVTIGNGVTSIGGSAFSDCTSLTSVTIGESVTTIDSSAFYDCSSLRSITIPDSVTSIGSYAFCGCTALTSVTIGSGVTKIGENAFYRCYWLQTVYCKPTTPPTGFRIDTNATSVRIYVPMESVSAYKSASYWRDYSDKIFGYNF